MSINREQLDRLLADNGYGKSETLNGENGLIQRITKIILEQALQDEIVHLGSQEKSVGATQGGRVRDGKTAKTIIGNFGKQQVAAPRDRDAGSESGILFRRQTRPVGVNDKIVALYVRGMTSSEIQGHLKDIDGIDVSAEMISAFTGAIVSEVANWRIRPLESVYPLVYIDFIRAKVRDNGQVVNRTVYLAIGIALDGVKDVLGMWVAENDDVRFWLKTLAELKKRGVQDMFIVCADNLKGFAEAGKTVFPDIQMLPYVASIVRNCLKYVSWKERKEVMVELKAIYQAMTVEQAELELKAFAEKWDKSHPTISQIWAGNWERIIPLFSYPQDVRKVICTTNTIESLYMALDKVARDRRSFADDGLLLQLLYLTLTNITKRRSMPVRDWKAALNRFSVLFAGRMSVY